MKLCLITIFVFLLYSGSAHAQWTTCVDSGRVTTLFQCNQSFYNPVCGCNNITYRNECNAYNNHGVLHWRSGVCSGMDLDFYPNPVGPYTPLTVNLSYDELIFGTADIKIIDLYGKVWEQRFINNFNRTQIQFDMSTLMTGVYVLYARSSLNTTVVRKFSKF